MLMKSFSVTIQMRVNEQSFSKVLFIMLYKLVLTFKSVFEILRCDHSNESLVMSSTFQWCIFLACNFKKYVRNLNWNSQET